MSAVITGKKYLVTKMDRYNKYQTKQFHTHIHCTHNSWWLLLGWVTTKKYHPLLRFDRQTSTYGASTNVYNNNNNNNKSILQVRSCRAQVQALCMGTRWHEPSDMMVPCRVSRSTQVTYAIRLSRTVLPLTVVAS